MERHTSPVSTHKTHVSTHTRDNPRQAQARRNLRFGGQTRQHAHTRRLNIARQHAQDACQHAHTRQPPSSAARRSLDQEAHHVVSTGSTVHSCVELFGTWRNKIVPFQKNPKKSHRLKKKFVPFLKGCGLVLARISVNPYPYYRLGSFPYPPREIFNHKSFFTSFFLSLSLSLSLFLILSFSSLKKKKRGEGREKNR